MLSFYVFQGNEILCGLSQEEYESMIGLLEAAILATDLALYFKWVLPSFYKTSIFTTIIKSKCKSLAFFSSYITKIVI